MGALLLGKGQRPFGGGPPEIAHCLAFAHPDAGSKSSAKPPQVKQVHPEPTFPVSG
jgi:hypothetical protein